MGIRYNVTVTDDGTSDVLAMDLKANPTCISLFTHIITGSPTGFTVEYTNDDIQAADFDPATATWHPHPTIDNVTSDTDGNFAFPVAGIRLNLNAAAPTDSVQLIVIQAGPI